MMSVVAGYDSRDPQSSNTSVPDYVQDLGNSLKGLRIGIPANYYNEDVDDDVTAAIDDSCQVFRHLGAELIEVTVPDPGLTMRLGQLILAAEAAALHEKWLAENGRTTTRSPFVPRWSPDFLFQRPGTLRHCGCGVRC